MIVIVEDRRGNLERMEVLAKCEVECGGAALSQDQPLKPAVKTRSLLRLPTRCVPGFALNSPGFLVILMLSELGPAQLGRGRR